MRVGKWRISVDNDIEIAKTVTHINKAGSDPRVTGKTFYLKQGNMYKVTSESAMDIHDRLPAGNYFVRFHPEAGFYVERTDSFKLPDVIYGDTKKHSDRILNTYDTRPNSTGVLLVGEQGSGKTLLSKAISVYASDQQQMPTLIVNSPFCGDGFNTFLASITQPVIVLFDEFEKVYDKDAQPLLLTLFDGVIGGKKLYLLTANDKWSINSHMQNRPGRFFYMMEFKGLGVDFIKEYCGKNLKEPKHIENIVAISKLFPAFNFDMLQAMVEEVNRYGETPLVTLEFLNVKPTMEVRREYSFSIYKDGISLHPKDIDNTWDGNPFEYKFMINYYSTKTEKPMWKSAIFKAQDLKNFDGPKGIFVFKNSEGLELTLTEIKDIPDAAHDYKRLLEL